MNDAKLYNVIRAPRVSEKTVRGQEHNQYAFEVATDATRPTSRSLSRSCSMCRSSRSTS